MPSKNISHITISANVNTEEPYYLYLLCGFSVSQKPFMLKSDSWHCFCRTALIVSMKAFWITGQRQNVFVCCLSPLLAWKTIAYTLLLNVLVYKSIWSALKTEKYYQCSAFYRTPKWTECVYKLTDSSRLQNQGHRLVNIHVNRKGLTQ